MKKYHLSYSLSFSFGETVAVSHFRFKGIPSSLSGTVSSLSYAVTPHSWLSEERDVFGNTVIYGSSFINSRSLSLMVDAAVETREGGKPITLKDPIHLYSRASLMTQMGPSLREFQPSLGKRGKESNIQRAKNIMEALSSVFSYEKGVTDVNTKAEDAFRKGKGVCQDYAQIMIALLRDERIPTRYCCGLFPGEGESHAWIEVLSEGIWIGLDPANSSLTDQSYITLALGQDSRDTELNKGIFFGGGKQEMKTEYIMVEQ